MRQLRQEDRGLQRVESRIRAYLVVAVLVDPAVVPEPPHPCRERLVIACDAAGISNRAEVLSRVEAERRGITDGAGPTSAPASSVRLRGVLEEEQLVGGCKRSEAGKVPGMSVAVIRDDSGFAGRDRRLDGID